MEVFDKLDIIRKRVNEFKKEPLFSDEVKSRNNRYKNTVLAENNNLLRVMAKLIAYSNNAPSDKVTNMLNKGVFERVFHNFDLKLVANKDSELIKTNEWINLKEIRFRKKIDAIIKCAKLLLENYEELSSIEMLYKKCNLPQELSDENDIDLFWKQFDIILSKFQKIGMPYYKNMTTLLHLLLHLGFPCIKPDLIVMKVAAKLELITGRKNHNAYSIKEREHVVKTIQLYCISRNIKPAVIDLYLLVYGGQKGALKYVNDTFTPLFNID